MDDNTCECLRSVLYSLREFLAALGMLQLHAQLNSCA